MRKQSGIALITTLLLLLLMSAMVVGFMLLVTEGQRLSGMNNEQSRAFYGAESGMEKLTADLGSLFGTTYAPTGGQVDFLATQPPVLPSTTGVSYVDVLGASTYAITYPKDARGNPQAQFAQITSGSSPFQGMTALETTYTMTVAARTKTGGEAKLVRTTQTVGIPLFQFGVYCEGDCSFFAGPNFNFGGRVHTNGNLFLNSGGPSGATPADTGKNQLWLASPVTAAKDIFRDCLSNTNPESPTGQHPGSVEITKGGGAYQALGFGQGSLTGCLGTPKNTSWPSISASFNGNLRSGVKPLNLTITLLGNGASQPIDLIRRPVQNENTINPGVLGERYFSEASLKILLSDTAADITGLPCVSVGAPLNLAHLAQPVPGWITNPDSLALYNLMLPNAATTPMLPLAASGAAGGTNAVAGSYTQADGYWQATTTPIITGFIKIDAQTAYGAPCGTWQDVTQEILSLGYAGRNIDPVPQSLDGATLNPQWTGTNAAMDLGKSPALPRLPGLNGAGAPIQLSYQNGVAYPNGAALFTAISTTALPVASQGTCTDPHPNAVIRLERIRDNPSTVVFASGVKGTPAANLPKQSTVTQVCGVDPTTKAVLATLPTDYWPNVLFDTREGYNRQPQPGGAFNNRVTLGGTMNYIELDVRNLARWFSGTIGATGAATRDPNVAPNNFVVYVSDRRGNYVLPGTIAGTWPPLSPSGHETGEYGYGDFVNPATGAGCPNGALDTGEDLDGTAVLYTYGEYSFPKFSPTTGLKDSTGSFTADTLYQGVVSSLTATVADPVCATGSSGISPWPRTFLLNPNEARENPPALFRRALKLVNGSLITLPACPGGVSCGLTIATENPAYIQGDYNANSTVGGGFADPSVAASVIADAFTLLSNDWHDVNTFNSPFNVGGRLSNTAWYRLGVVAGKGISFPIPAWDTTAVDGSQDFGTDGGVHNFMRYLERWGGTLNYTGSIISLYYNRQGIGLYNSGTNNYSPPNRGYQFDSNFLNPLLLPPRTPMFRDINTTGFTQLLLPNQ
ncbi:MAG TPA: PilX N-terminal domain-containing pilus assembly protein [Candidatus Acidoferrum sp.]|nr:PilX N-terminal domain-containing pilus assembly protein [Candidatus Acidoferrum sp.]